MRLVTAATLAAAATLSEGANIPLYLYVDQWNGFNTGQEFAEWLVKVAEAGASHILLAFYLDNPNFPNHIADSVSYWDQLSDSEQQTYAGKIASAGGKLLMSNGGGTEEANWLQTDGAEYGQRACKYAADNHYHGVDFDKEGIGATSAQALEWMKKAIKACRSSYPDLMLTSAPQSPFMLGSVWWTDLENSDPMDAYLIQYYNQGEWAKETDYTSLVSTGPGNLESIWTKYPSAGKSKFVIGKILEPGDGGTGYVEPLAMKEMVCKAWTEKGYRGGMMFWKVHPTTDMGLIGKLAAGCGGGNDDTTTTTTTTTTTPTTTTTTTPAATTTTTTPSTGTTVPTSSPTSTTTTSTTTHTTGDAVAACRQMISGVQRDWTEYCRNFCSVYQSSLAAWCPTSQTGAGLATCVVKQQGACVLSG